MFKRQKVLQEIAEILVNLMLCFKSPSLAFSLYYTIYFYFYLLISLPLPPLSLLDHSHLDLLRPKHTNIFSMMSASCLA